METNRAAGRRPARVTRWLRTWLVAGLDEDTQRARKGHLAGGLYLGADLYAALITAQNPQARTSQAVIVAVVALLGATLLVLPWSRFRDSVLIWPVIPSAFLTTLGEGGFGVLDHYEPVYVLSLGYAGLVLRPGRTTGIAALNLVLLAGVALTGRQHAHLTETVGTILASALIGELIAAAIATQRRQQRDLEDLHAGLRPLLAARSEPEATNRVSDLAANLLRADGVVTMMTDPAEPGRVLTARGGSGSGADPEEVRVDLDSGPSGLSVIAQTRQHLFVADARNHPLVSPLYVQRYDSASLLYVPILVGDQLTGAMVIWWTTPIDDLDHFTDQVVELLSLQAGPVLERVRQVEELDRAATTDSLTGVLNRRGYEDGMRHLAEDALLLVFDLDRFKQLNDTKGHPAGDRVLRAFAATLTSSVRGTDLVCRIGGDEFAVILRGGQEVAEAVLARLTAAWTHPEDVGFSAGYGMRQLGESPEDLNARADASLYEQKKARRRLDSR